MQGGHPLNPCAPMSPRAVTGTFFANHPEAARTGRRGALRPAGENGTRSAAEGTTEVVMSTRGEVEAAVSDGVTRFEQEYMGRGPKHIRTYLLGDLLVVRLQG